MPHAKKSPSILTPYARDLIRVKARQLCRRRGFSRSDFDDLRQELWLVLLKQAHRYNSQRASLNTFIDRVVDSAVGMILRNRRRLKRAEGFQAESLESLIEENGCPESIEEGLCDEDRCRRNGLEPAVDEAVLDEDADAFEHALDAMPADVLDVCRRLMSGSIAAVARDLGTSRRQVRNTLAEARPFFERAGFGDPAADTPPANGIGNSCRDSHREQQ